MLQERFYCNGNRFRPDSHTELFYRSWISLKPRLVLILIHGAGQHSGHFVDLALYCSQHGFALYALDLRGFGKSAGKRGHINSFYEYLNDLDQFIQYVKQKHPGYPVFLLGYSLGGAIVIRYEQEHQNTIQGAILAAPALKLRIQIPKSFNFMFHMLSRVTPGLVINLNKWSNILSKVSWLQSIFNEDFTKECEYYKEVDPLLINQYSIRWYTELIVNGYQALRKVNDFRSSALFICGTDDQVIDPASVQDFFDFLRIKDKTIMMFTKTNHGLFQDHKEIVYQHLIKWLNERV